MSNANVINFPNVRPACRVSIGQAIERCPQCDQPLSYRDGYPFCRGCRTKLDAWLREMRKEMRE